MEKTQGKKNSVQDPKLSKIEDIVQCRLTEYESWRKFLQVSWQQRYILVGLNIAALGTLISLAITNNNLFIPFLLIACFVSLVLGLVWVAETRWGIKIEHELRKHCINELRNITGNLTLFATDEELRKPGTDKKGPNTFSRHLLSGQSPAATIGFFIYFLPSLISFIIAITTAFKFEEWDILSIALTLVDFVLLALLGISGYLLASHWIRDIQDLR